MPHFKANRFPVIRKLGFELSNEGKIPVTKLDAAVRQLEAAITLWFSDGDPVVMCALTYNAYEVIRAINRQNKGSAMITDLFAATDSKQKRDELHFIFNMDANFVKHATKDAAETHHLTVQVYPLIMADAISAYNRLGFPPRPLFLALLLWFSLTRPELGSQEARDMLSGFRSIYDQGNLTKKDFLHAALQFVESRPPG